MPHSPFPCGNSRREIAEVTPDGRNDKHYTTYFLYLNTEGHHRQLRQHQLLYHDPALFLLRQVHLHKLLQLHHLTLIGDLNSVGYLLRHNKTGARVALLSNDDENKVFYIGFRTPPKDSTGVAHIVVLSA